MQKSSLTPIELGDNPELAALCILATSLDVAERALVAAYPESCEPSYSEGSRSEPEAFALSIRCQINALSAVLDEYAGSIRRLRECRSRELPADDIAF